MKHQPAKLSLRIKHPTRDLMIVCGTLGLRPSVLWKAGDPRRTPKGNMLGGRRTESFCSIDIPASRRKSLVDQMRTALILLKPRRRILKMLSSTGGRISFFVGLFCDEHTGESFDCQLLGEMTALQIALDLNIYIPDY
jgi:hypothetical protein